MTISSYTQHHRLSCGPACIKILMDFFDIKNTCSEEIVAKSCYTTSLTGTLPYWVIRWLRKHLPECWHSLIYNADIEQLLAHLRSWNPAILMYMVDRDTNPYNWEIWSDLYWLHYSVAYELQWDTILLNNPFWFLDEININILWDRMSLDNKFLDNKEKLLLFLWIIRRHTAILVQKND